MQSLIDSNKCIDKRRYVLRRNPCRRIFIRGQKHNWQLIVVIRNFLIHLSCLKDAKQTNKQINN